MNRNHRNWDHENYDLGYGLSETTEISANIAVSSQRIAFKLNLQFAVIVYFVRHENGRILRFTPLNFYY